MKKLISVLAIMASVCVVNAATESVSLTVTNGQAITYTAPINVSGILDKIEVVQSSGCTSTVTIATYSGTTAIETFASLSSMTTPKVVRPRILPTDNTGTSLAAVSNLGTSVGTVLSVNYARPTIGGNVKMAVTSGATVTGTNTVTATFYYDKAPLVAW